MIEATVPNQYLRVLDGETIAYGAPVAVLIRRVTLEQRDGGWYAEYRGFTPEFYESGEEYAWRYGFAFAAPDLETAEYLCEAEFTSRVALA